MVDNGAPPPGQPRGPLSGISVVDFSQWQQGPYATVILSDMGASVLKVEKPGYGDAGRHALGGYREGEPAPDFFAHNRGKRSITIELSHPRGRELALELGAHADVVVHNFRLGQMERWGLGYEAFRESNPAIIYAHASGSGTRGPERERPMFDIVAQAMGGIMSVNGEEEAPPTPVGTFVADQVGATMLAMGILAALVARERTGQGQTVDVSLLGSQIGLQSFEITHYLATGRLPGRAGRGHPHSGVLWNTFPARDGYFAMAGVREDRWPEFCALVGDPSLASDPCFETAAGRAANRRPLTERLDAIFCRETVEHWTVLLATLDIACGPVRTYDQVAADPQVLENNYITPIAADDRAGPLVVNTPIALGAMPVRPQGPAPELGQHTEEVLLELGYDWPGILSLREDGAI